MEVALAAIGLAATTVGALIWVVKFIASELTSAIREHTKAAMKQAEASRKQTESSEEVLKFMKNLNGKLEGAFVAKVKEKSL